MCFKRSDLLFRKGKVTYCALRDNQKCVALDCSLQPLLLSPESLRLARYVCDILEKDGRRECVCMSACEVRMMVVSSLEPRVAEAYSLSL